MIGLCTGGVVLYLASGGIRRAGLILLGSAQKIIKHVYLYIFVYMEMTQNIFTAKFFDANI